MNVSSWARIAPKVTAVLALTAMTGAGPFSTGAAAAESPPPRPADDMRDAVVGTDWGDVTTRQENRSLDRSGDWTPEDDVSSLYSLTAAQGIQDAWRAGVTGEGVTVAVIDTGVAPVRGLPDTPDKVMHGPDLSFDSQDPDSRYLDVFGHGTHMSGIIAGRDAGWDPQDPRPEAFAGVAPDAQLLNMKVGASDGGVDVSQVIAALNWIVQHQNDDGMNVQVVSLAYGTPSVQPWQVDPLAKAVEDAWRAGIVVVAAVGNDGLDTDRLLMPAIDPHVIAVGAADPNGTVDLSDDVVADFTNGGSAERRPDLLAPGRSIVSLRVPGSYIDTTSPEGRVEGDDTQRFFRGSGTSQATAYVAGVAALLLDEQGDLAPEEVKTLLMGTARPVAEADPAAGAGIVDVPAALGLADDVESDSALAARNTFPWGSGDGSLEASRGGEHVVDPLTGRPLQGEYDAQGTRWDGAAWAASSQAHRAWDGGTWNDRTWTGEGFEGNRWRFAPWRGITWAGVPWLFYAGPAAWEERWPDVDWNARSWRNLVWLARSWRNEDWTARSWRDFLWEARSWRDDGWTARSWRDLLWEARSWRNDAWEARSWRDGDWEARSWRDFAWEARSWRNGAWEARSWRNGAWEARSWREDSWSARSWRALS